MAQVDGTVLPKPGVPKTLGILSVIFAVLLLLLGTCALGFTAAGPTIVTFFERIQKENVARVEALKQSQVKAFDDREKAATTDEEKAAIRRERDAAIASLPKVQAVDMGSMMGQLTDPTVRFFSVIQLSSGIVLHVMLLVTGIGLIRLTAWGRSGSVAWAWLQLAQIAAVMALSLVYVQPVMKVQTEKMLAKMEADARAPGAAPGTAESIKFSRLMASPAMMNGMIFLNLVAGCTYPVVVLILLNTPGARAACLGPRPAGLDGT